MMRMEAAVGRTVWIAGPICLGRPAAAQEVPWDSATRQKGRCAQLREQGMITRGRTAPNKQNGSQPVIREGARERKGSGMDKDKGGIISAIPKGHYSSLDGFSTQGEASC